MVYFRNLVDRVREGLAEKKRFVLVLDGPCGAGKTTLANALSRKLPCRIIHTDDFFLQPHQRTETRLQEPGGNLDRERFLEEVLLPLREGKSFSYRPFDCGRQAFSQPVFIGKEPLIVVEGTYSLHPDFGRYYDLSVFLSVGPLVQMQRIMKRSPQLYSRFLTQWIPMEERYFDTFQIREKCDLVLDAVDTDALRAEE